MRMRIRGHYGCDGRASRPRWAILFDPTELALVVLVKYMSHELLVWGDIKGCEASAIEGPRGRKDSEAQKHLEPVWRVQQEFYYGH